jgi:hypothetical protein
VSVDVADLARQVQGNCDIADASSAGVFSLCGFLLRLRDFYKWEHGLLPWQEPEPATLLAWVEAREEAWAAIAEEALQPIRIGGETFDVFDLDAINRLLRPAGLVYGAGYVAGMKSSFFLAELVTSQQLHGLRVDTVDRELARDLFVTPAMRRGDQIFVRRSAMLFFLWDQVLELRPSAKVALSFAFRQYHLDVESLRRSPSELGPQLHRVVATELEAWVYHEIGEVREDAFDGLLWQEIVATYAGSQVEIFARVVKDLLADTHSGGLLGHIVGQRLRSSLGFFVAFMRAFTRLMFPEILEGFVQFTTTGEWAVIEEARRRGHANALSLARALIELHESGRRKGADWAREQIIATLIEPLRVPGAPRKSH